MASEDITALMRGRVVEARFLAWLVPIVAWLGWTCTRAGRQPARARIERLGCPGAPSTQAGARSRRRRSEADIAARQGEVTVEESRTGGSAFGLGFATPRRQSGGRRREVRRLEVCPEEACGCVQGRAECRA